MKNINTVSGYSLPDPLVDPLLVDEKILFETNYPINPYFDFFIGLILISFVLLPINSYYAADSTMHIVILSLGAIIFCFAGLSMLKDVIIMNKILITRNQIILVKNFGNIKKEFLEIEEVYIEVTRGGGKCFFSCSKHLIFKIKINDQYIPKFSFRLNDFQNSQKDTLINIMLKSTNLKKDELLETYESKNIKLHKIKGI